MACQWFEDSLDVATLRILIINEKAPAGLDRIAEIDDLPLKLTPNREADRGSSRGPL